MSVDSDTARTRREIEREREALTAAVGNLRGRIEETRRQPVRPRAVTVAAVAVAGFVLAGGVHATIRLLGARERRRRQRSLAGLRELLPS
jgi:hypothetical protein